MTSSMRMASSVCGRETGSSKSSNNALQQRPCSASRMAVCEAAHGPAERDVRPLAVSNDSAHSKAMVEIKDTYDPESIIVARALFKEYQQALGVDLSFQDFATELATLPGAYAPPRGRLFLARDDSVMVGCVAMRPLTSKTCEMKRLYVRPGSRAGGVGRQLAERVIAEARAMGYRQMYLDTLPMMAGAQRLYEQLGFKDIPPYRHNPVEGTRFLGLEL